MTEPSAWVRRWAHLIVPGGRVLDVAAGSGRHTTWLGARGHPVTAVDRDAAVLAALGASAEIVVADLESAPWPFEGRRFDAIIVTNYLWRPLFAALPAALAEGGVLLYETFAAGQETVGRPARPEFLLGRGELLGVMAGLRIVAFEDGFLPDPERFVQRIVAVREAPATRPPRHALAGPTDGRGPADPAR